jgi:adenylate cyclase
MSRRRQIQFQQWLILTLAWEFMAVWISVYDHLVVHSSLAGSVSPDYSFLSNMLIINCGGALIGSLLGGSFLIFYVNTRLNHKSYGATILLVLITIAVVMTIVTLVVAYFYVTVIQGIPVSHPDFGNMYVAYALDPVNLKDTLMWSTITALTQFVFQMNAKFGHGTLWKIITGKYRRPRAEVRIFMFVDLNSSTTIAERLGAETYHRLLADFFDDLTNPIVDNDGEIYQYVGDEVVVAWNYKKGIMNDHCVQCFFDMKKEIENRKAYYRETYGWVPSFKAAIHAGKVIAGEIGIIKRDITFSGDVLNTTARIQGKCKEFNVEILASSELLHSLPEHNRYTFRELGTIELKGKENRIALSTLTMAS